MAQIYFDHAATTPMVDEAIEVFTRHVSKIGNASSLHSHGREIRKDVEEARESIAAFAGCLPSEIIFTGSGTEANNTAIKGLWWNAQKINKDRKVIITSPFEHHAVMDPIYWLYEHEGAEIIEVPVSPDGYVSISEFEKIIDQRVGDIAFISIMHANNEIGTVQPIAQLTERARKHSLPFHTDAVQSFGKVEFNYSQMGLTAATLSAHKVGGPLGVGALIVRRGLDLTPILHGGGQERDIRSGTLNAPGIVSFAAAVTKLSQEFTDRNDRIRELKGKLKKLLTEKVSDIAFNGGTNDKDANTLPSILNVTFPGASGDVLLLLLDAEGISTSTGSACSAGVPQASHVLLALGISEKLAKSTLRFSLGHTSSDADVEYLGTVISKVVERARAAGSRS